MAVSFDDIFDLSEAEPGELREWEEHWRDLPPRQGRHHRPHLRHDRRPEGRGADPRQHPAQLRGRHPGGRLQRARPVPLVPAALAHDRARGRSGRAAGSRLHDRLCRAGHRAAGGQHGRDRADRDGRRAAPVRDACTPGSLSTVEAGPASEPAHLPLGGEASGAQHYQNHLDGRAGLGLARHADEGRRSARVLTRSGLGPAGASATSCPAARRCHGRSASSSTPWAC